MSDLTADELEQVLIAIKERSHAMKAGALYYDPADDRRWALNAWKLLERARVKLEVKAE